MRRIGFILADDLKCFNPFIRISERDLIAEADIVGTGRRYDLRCCLPRCPVDKIALRQGCLTRIGGSIGGSQFSCSLHDGFLKQSKLARRHEIALRPDGALRQRRWWLASIAIL